MAIHIPGRKLPVKIPNDPSKRYLNHVLPERGKVARAVSGKGFLVLNTTRNFLHCLSPYHGTCELSQINDSALVTCNYTETHVIFGMKKKIYLIDLNYKH